MVNELRGKKDESGPVTDKRSCVIPSLQPTWFNRERVCQLVLCVFFVCVCMCVCLGVCRYVFLLHVCAFIYTPQIPPY